MLKYPVQREEIKEWNRKRRTGDLSWVQISSCRAFPQYEGLRIPEIARQMGVDEYEAVFNLIVGSNDNANACYFTMRSGGKTMVTFLFDCCFAWVINVPIAYILAHYTDLGVLTVYALSVYTVIIKDILGGILVHKRYWVNTLSAQ